MKDRVLKRAAAVLSVNSILMTLLLVPFVFLAIQGAFSAGDYVLTLVSALAIWRIFGTDEKEGEDKT